MLYDGKVKLKMAKLPEAGVLELHFASNDLPAFVPLDALREVGDQVTRKLNGERRELVEVSGVFDRSRAHLIAEHFTVIAKDRIEYRFALQTGLDPLNAFDMLLMTQVILRQLDGQIYLEKVQVELDLGDRQQTVLVPVQGALGVDAKQLTLDADA